MATTLSLLEIRVKAVLMDVTGQVWDLPTIDGSIRMALGEYQLAGQAAVTVQGLDEALVTSLETLHESVIVWGAAAYAALSRAVDRAESFQLGSESDQLRSWGEARLKEFKAMLGSVFPGYRAATAGSGAGESAVDPAKVAAEIALLAAQAAHLNGEESRAAAAAQVAQAEKAAEAQRRAGLRASTAPSWGSWRDLIDCADDEYAATETAAADASSMGSPERS